MGRLQALVISDATVLKDVKTKLESNKYINKTKKIEKRGDEFVIYTTVEEDDFNGNQLLSSILSYVPHSIEYHEIDLDVIDKGYSIPGSYHKNISLAACFYNYCHENSIPSPVYNALLQSLPKKWSIYPPMVLFSSNTFESDIWRDHAGFFPFLITNMFPSATHIAVNKPIIESDEMRRPFSLVPVYGNFGPTQSPDLFESPSDEDFEDELWCSVVQNGISQCWAPRYTMFSRGNIKEKKRVLDTFQVNPNDVILDLYSGIGYFTFSYIKKGGIVFCWEINKWSIEGLQRGMIANGFKFKVVEKDETINAAQFQSLLNAGTKAFIFNESNITAPKRMEQLDQTLPIKHINLGLLPSSQQSWEITSTIIQKYSQCPTSIHVHENVSIHDFEKFKESTLEYFCNFGTTEFLHLEKVKTFAPDIWHIVVDYLHHPS